MEPAGLEFVADKSQPEHPAPECVFFIVRFGFPCRGFLLCEGLMGDRKAELDVGLDFAGVERVPLKRRNSTVPLVKVACRFSPW